MCTAGSVCLHAEWPGVQQLQTQCGGVGHISKSHGRRTMAETTEFSETRNHSRLCSIQNKIESYRILKKFKACKRYFGFIHQRKFLHIKWTYVNIDQVFTENHADVWANSLLGMTIPCTEGFLAFLAYI